MLSRINRFIIFVVLISIGAYVVYLNSQQITLVIPFKGVITATAGLIYLGIFFAGMFCAGSVSIFFGIKSYLRERRLKSRDRQHSEFLKGILRARSCLSAGEWRKAADLWQGLIRRDQSSVVARIELSRALEFGGEVHEALKVVDEARSAEPHNTEVLFRAAELNLALKNKTAAIDNLALILFEEPNLRAAQMARDLSEDLGRFEDALEYQAKLESLGYNSELARSERSRIKFKRLMAGSSADLEALEAGLKEIVRADANCSEALKELALIEKRKGHVDQAAQYFVRAAKAAGSPKLWQEATALWLAHGMPDRAVSAARSATRETHGIEKLRAELNLIRVYLAFQMLDDAKRSLDDFRNLARDEQVEIDPAMARKLLLLRTWLELGRGDHNAAIEILENLADERLEYEPGASGTFEYSRTNNAPSPSLSTP